MTRTIDDLIPKCLNKDIAEVQRIEEQGNGIQTQGFTQVGCYNCNGQDINCKAYFPLEQIPKEAQLYENRIRR